jgi:ABC-type bacteriocin/lantibiotic exporter with double-glycine peptidase domain
VFGYAGVITSVVLAIGLLIGGIGFCSTFIARLIVERMPVHVHTAILDVVVIAGAAIMIFDAVRP